MVEIQSVNKISKSVKFDDGTKISSDDFKKKFVDFFKKRIAGETLVHSDMERFMSRTSSKNLALLMKGKKMEGFLEGSQGKLLTRGQKIAIASIATILMVVIIGIVVLRTQGII